MRHVELENGFACDIAEDALNDMELVDALTQLSEENPYALSKVCILLLGTETRNRLYDFLRTEHGKVPVNLVSDSITAIFNALGKDGKNSSPSAT